MKKKLIILKIILHTFDGFAIIPLTRIYTVNSYGTSPPSATIFLIRSPSFEPYLKRVNKFELAINLKNLLTVCISNLIRSPVEI